MTEVNLAADLIGTVADAAHFSPRNRQVSIGPSEVGVACVRRLAGKVVNTPATWTNSDPWASIVGVATHAWLASAFAGANLGLDEPRWLTEERVYPHPSMPGSCDLYDLWSDTVVDHKIVGTTTMSSAKKNGPSAQYRVQSNLYGLGWERRGRTPREVAIAYWPRSGYLSGLFLHREPYDRELAIAALDRLTLVSATALTLEVVEHPERLMLLPATPGDDCKYCPYKNVREGDGGCPDFPRPEIKQPLGKVASLKL
jgi:hypothetical protein